LIVLGLHVGILVMTEFNADYIDLLYYFYLLLEDLIHVI